MKSASNKTGNGKLTTHITALRGYQQLTTFQGIESGKTPGRGVQNPPQWRMISKIAARAKRVYPGEDWEIKAKP